MKSLFLALILVATQSLAQSPEVTPYRPGVGSPAVLSATDHFELEVGYDKTKISSTRTQVLGDLIKYGLSDQVGLLFGQPAQQISADGITLKGLGDGLIGVKFVQKINPELAGGLQLTSSIPTGKRAIFRANKTTTTLTGLLGFDFSGLHADLNLGFTKLGDVEFNTSRNQTNYSLGISKALDGGWSLGIEASGSKVSGNPSGTTLLGSVSYTVNKNFAIDASVSRSRFDNVNGANAGIGFTYLFAK
jgi:Putative MetA-pathway of phenol degradation